MSTSSSRSINLSDKGDKVEFTMRNRDYDICAIANIRYNVLEIEQLFRCSSKPGSASRSINTIVKQVRLYCEENSIPTPTKIKLHDAAYDDRIDSPDVIYLSSIETLKTGHSFYGKMGFRPQEIKLNTAYNNNLSIMSSLKLSDDTKTKLLEIIKVQPLDDIIKNKRCDTLLTSLMIELLKRNDFPYESINLLLKRFGLVFMAHAWFYKEFPPL